MNAAGTRITINGFSLMNLGNYEIDFSFLGAMPTITNIKTIANGFTIEDAPITQTTNINDPVPGSITINTLNIIES